MLARRSVRAFRPDPVPQPLLEHVFALANRAPSNCNTQPWLTAVASGAACERLRRRFQADFASGQVSMDFPYAGKYAGVYKERQYDAAEKLYGAMGIAREDKAARGAAFMRNFTFFDAPHVAFLFIPDWAGVREAADAGMYAQTLMLALSAHGLGELSADRAQLSLRRGARGVRRGSPRSGCCSASPSATRTPRTPRTIAASAAPRWPTTCAS